MKENRRKGENERGTKGKLRNRGRRERERERESFVGNFNNREGIFTRATFPNSEWSIDFQLARWQITHNSNTWPSVCSFWAPRVNASASCTPCTLISFLLAGEKVFPCQRSHLKTVACENGPQMRRGKRGPKGAEMKVHRGQFYVRV